MGTPLGGNNNSDRTVRRMLFRRFQRSKARSAEREAPRLATTRIFYYPPLRQDVRRGEDKRKLAGRASGRGVQFARRRWLAS